MSWNVVRLHEVDPVPWRNGGGLTRELVAWPGDRDWLWRMSVATVDHDGPFSSFDGVERWFAVLDGEGVALDIDGRGRLSTHRLTASDQPFFFDGGWKTNCRLLGGTTHDFNLMARQRAGSEFSPSRSRMARVGGGFAVPVSAKTTLAMYALANGVAGRLDDEAFAWPAASLSWRCIETDARLSIDSGRALLMEIEA